MGSTPKACHFCIQMLQLNTLIIVSSIFLIEKMVKLMGEYIEYDGKTIKIMTCSNCNMKCKQCYVAYTGNFESEKLFQVVGLLKSKYEILLNGTEPLINNYLDSFKISDEKFILTNGLVFKNNLNLVNDIKNAGINRICMSYQYEIQKDIDSVSLSYLDEIFPKIRDMGIDVEMMCTITSKNYNLLDEICEKAIKLKANYLYLLEYMYQGNAQSKMSGDLRLTDQMRENFFEDLKKVREKYDKYKLYIYRSGNMGDDNINHKKVVCGAGIDMVTMTPDYKIYPCNLLIDERFCIGYFDGEKVYIDKDKRDEVCGNFNSCLWTKYKN